MSDAEDQTSPEPDADLAARVAQAEAERDEFRDRWMRGEAEMQNVRNRARRDAEDARNFAVQKFATDVSETAENLRRGLAALPARREGEPDVITRMREGFAGVERSFIAMLERHGVRAADPTGMPFDPDMHQAMGEQESDQHPPGTVLQAWTSAWTLNGRLLRPAMVVVSKAPAAELEADRSHLDTLA
jgi:molecular chaperone GrpE